jgi:ComF family protein
MVYKWLDFNRHCMLCDTSIPGGDALCGDCQQALPWIGSSCPCCGSPMEKQGDKQTLCGECLSRPPHYRHSFIPLLYRPPVAHLIKQMKFHQRLDIAQGMGMLMSHYLAATVDALPEVIVPVPLHARRMRQRGYNQALELARPLAARLEVPIDTVLVQRRRATDEQSHLKLAERKRNIRGAFAMDRHRPYRHVAILDDVVTSGNTVNELARVLRAAGIERVDVWSCCRASGRD